MIVENKIGFLREKLLRSAPKDGILSSNELNYLLTFNFDLDLIKYVTDIVKSNEKIERKKISEVIMLLNQIENPGVSISQLNYVLFLQNGRLLTTLQHLIAEFVRLQPQSIA